MHVRCTNNGYILGVRTASSASHIHASHSLVPDHGNLGLGQDLCLVHEGDQHDVHGWADDRGGGAAFQTAQEGGFVDRSSGRLFS
jgi:hypothetical protein